MLRLGHAGLGLLAKFQTDYIKLDMELIRDIDASLPRRMIVEGVMRIALSLDIAVIAEGDRAAGTGVLQWDGVRRDGSLAPAGIYQVVLRRLEPVGLVVLWPEARG